MNVLPGLYIIIFIGVLSALIIITTLIDIFCSNEYSRSLKKIENNLKSNDQLKEAWLLDDNYSVVIDDEKDEATFLGIGILGFRVIGSTGIWTNSVNTTFEVMTEIKKQISRTEGHTSRVMVSVLGFGV